MKKEIILLSLFVRNEKPVRANAFVLLINKFVEKYLEDQKYSFAVINQ